MPPATLAPVTATEKVSVNSLPDSDAWKKKSYFQLFNISVGFLGIQFAWAIQMGQMSPILEKLGSDPQMMGIISCAGPVTGVLVQPIIGALSDRCRLPLGQRRPFLLLGAVLTAFALVLMPGSNSLVMAAVLLWLLDASINITQGPYRALVPDVVHKSQQATAYSLMGLTIGLGSVAAFLIAAQITSLQYLFNLGALVMLAAMAWTAIFTPEPAPEAQKPLESLRTGAQTSDNLEPSSGFIAGTLKSIMSMPFEGLKLCIAHSFTWFGLACLFTFFSVYVPHHIFGALSTNDLAYQQGGQWTSYCYAMMNAVCFVFSALIGKFCNVTSKKTVHSFGLLCMAGAFTAMMFIHTPMEAMIAMGFVGIGWATTLSIPFALLSEHLPPGKVGVMMGTFNIFIAAPGVVSNLLVGKIVSAYGNNVSVGMLVGGLAILISMLILQTVHEKKVNQSLDQKSTGLPA